MSEFIQLRLFRRKWRKENSHNETAPDNIFPLSLVNVGKYTYGRLKVLAFNENNHLTIGSYCSIGPEVMFVLSADHHLNHISTFPFQVKVTHTAETEGVSKGDIVVEDDVWIGCRATILSGVTIGQGAVIAAGSVVTKDVPPYAIVAGVPAKVIKYRFSEDVYKELEKIDYSKLDTEFVKKNIDLLYQEITQVSDIKVFVDSVKK